MPIAEREPRNRPPELDSATTLSLQQTAGNAAVSSLIARAPARPLPARAAREDPGDAAISAGLARAAIMRAPQERTEVVERMPTIPEPGVRYVVQKAQKAYTFEATVFGKPVVYANLTPEQAVAKLKMLWRFCQDDLDEGRMENVRQADRRREHRTAGYWSELIGRTEVPDPDMWDEVGRGSLSQGLVELNKTEAQLKGRWEEGEAATQRNLPPELANNPMMKDALAFDPTEERIK